MDKESIKEDLKKELSLEMLAEMVEGEGRRAGTEERTNPTWCFAGEAACCTRDHAEEDRRAFRGEFSR